MQINEVCKVEKAYVVPLISRTQLCSATIKLWNEFQSHLLPLKQRPQHVARLPWDESLLQ